MLLNVKDFILTESKLVLLSYHSGMGTPSSLWISCIHLDCWSCSCLGPQAPAYCSEVVLLIVCTLCFTKCWALSLMCVAPQYLQFSILYPLFCFLDCCLSPTLICLLFCIWSKSFMSSKIFSVLSALPLFGPTLLPNHCLFLVYSFGPLVPFCSLAWFYCLYHLWTVLWAFYHVLYSYIMWLLCAVCPSIPVWIHCLFYVICTIVTNVSFHYAEALSFLLAHWTVLLCFGMHLSQSYFSKGLNELQPFLA